MFSRRQPDQGGTRLPRTRRWPWIAGVVTVAVFALVVVGLTVVYPKVAAHMIRSRAERLATKLDRAISIGSIDVSLGHVVVRDLSVKGPLDGDLPLVHVDRIDVDFDAWASLVGHVELGEATVDGVIATVRRTADGRDNVRDAIAHYRAVSAEHGGGTGHSPRPTKITLTHARLLANDEQTGATALVGDGDAVWTPELIVAHGRGITATTTGAPKATLASLEIRRRQGQPPVVKIGGGELELWPRMALSGIAGEVIADPDRPGLYTLALAGGYGGVPGQLWTANGNLDPKDGAAHVDLEAAKFQLDRLAPILAQSAVVDYQATAIDTKVHIDVDKAGAKFAGGFHLTGLNVGHPYIADKEVHDLDLSGQIEGSFDRATRKLELTKGDFISRNVPFSITGSVVAPKVVDLEVHEPRKDPDGTERTPPMRGPHGIQQLEVRLLIPPIDCQRMLDAFPVEMVPYMHGYKVRGVFDLDIHTAIDWSDLDNLELGGHIAINKCKVVDEPADSPKRLKDEFEQYVETEKGEWSSFVVGPSNPDFVPIDQISPFLLKSIQSSEDFGFYKHHGFIPTEFRTALINNLKREKFVQGASSITMQMVKNVLLFREKTLARKLQELFLTWHVENTLDKDRIFEIYLNVIEFGPDLYGIGPAAQYYFGKPAKDLNAVEAAFFSTILPDPKGRSAQYCANELTKWTKTKIEHILANELKRKQLTQEEFDKATATPLVFYKTFDSESEEDCLKRVKKAIKNARPTNPLKDRADDAKRDKKPERRPHKKPKHKAS
ncbi:MAG: transglycosylase domain-containing protein [Kofleriaceae bacterium]